MIESEGDLGMGKVGEPIDPYLVPDMDYSKWWATQTCGPLGGPVEGEVYLFTLIGLFVVLLCF